MEYIQIKTVSSHTLAFTQVEILTLLPCSYARTCPTARKAEIAVILIFY